MEGRKQGAADSQVGYWRWAPPVILFVTLIIWYVRLPDEGKGLSPVWVLFVLPAFSAAYFYQIRSRFHHVSYGLSLLLFVVVGFLFWRGNHGGHISELEEDLYSWMLLVLFCYLLLYTAGWVLIRIMGKVQTSREAQILEPCQPPMQPSTALEVQAAVVQPQSAGAASQGGQLQVLEAWPGGALQRAEECWGEIRRLLAGMNDALRYWQECAKIAQREAEIYKKISDSTLNADSALWVRGRVMDLWISFACGLFTTIMGDKGVSQIKEWVAALTAINGGGL